MRVKVPVQEQALEWGWMWEWNCWELLRPKVWRLFHSLPVPVTQYSARSTARYAEYVHARNHEHRDSYLHYLAKTKMVN